MDSINSWINEAEVRKLADDLTSTAKISVKSDDEGDFGADESLDTSKSKAVKEEVNLVNVDKSLSLASACARAASAGLLDSKKPSSSSPSSSVERNVQDVSAQAPPLCDHFLNAIPVNIDTREKTPLNVPELHSKKGAGTFGDIDKLLTESVQANGICVIDRDGDVLYSSLENQYLVVYTVDTMKKSKLMFTKDGEVGHLRLKLSANDFFEFVSVKSTRGVIVLGAKMKDSLTSKGVKQVAEDVLRIANMA